MDSFRIGSVIAPFGKMVGAKHHPYHKGQTRRRTWCSSAKRENFDCIPQTQRVSFVSLSNIVEHNEIHNPRCALQHRYSMSFSTQKEIKNQNGETVRY